MNTIISELNRMKKIHESKVIRRSILEEDLTGYISEKKKLDRKIINTKQARSIIQESAKTTQKNLEYHISELCTLALSSVIENPPEFVTKFEMKRNRTEVHFYFKENNVLQDPLKSSGGGALDVTSLALRLVKWSLLPNKTRPTFLLDEPFRNVDSTAQQKCGELLKLLSDTLGIQFIVISHQPNVDIVADKTFTIIKEHGISKLKKEN